ncbi:MAG: hypothetical protein JNK21_05750 [Rhodospirillaceae bacterium]|nr:hypothetical protein [Rhodospirillaceae bacterium]
MRHQGAAAAAECVLDALRDTGLLDGAEGTRADRSAVGRSRYEQGLWLRQLYFRAGLQALQALDMTRAGAGAPGGPGGGVADISDETARARLRYNRTVRELGPFAEAVTSFVCCDRIRRGEPHLTMVRKGLDRLCVMRQ